MRFLNLVIVLSASTISFSTALDLDQNSLSSIKDSASDIAKSLTFLYPDKDVGLLPAPYWWWQSGSALDGLIAYWHTTGDGQYNNLVAKTLVSQGTDKKDFMTPDATGNDDQAWRGIAAMSAAEYGLLSPPNSPSWLELTQNVLNEQKGRWDDGRCGGGMKWKINQGDDGWHYKSTITNGLFFQLAARIGRFTGDVEALKWAEKSYDWTVGVGLIDKDYNVYDGTDDAKGSGCVDVNHDQWSYNVGVFMYGAAVMADKTGDKKWADRANGFVSSAQRNFVKNGALFESKCEGQGNCNTDQQSFKAALARWMGATATLLPDTKDEVGNVMGDAAGGVAKAFDAKWGATEQLTALETVGALICTSGKDAPGKPKEGKRGALMRFVA
ncbi:glycoside hydrolase family 76 protein [Zopfia rhizophila CBS 207.26]|uniref:mannan endo-1,6-alpha-mannosidase n=1 Tax=Zopfia rhizophila CBS 207.26 TaxID=1314779 RepID=A0A6A6E6Y2_9PEZI|nr:glycoside hydrolase family 76 protein [Zopfia rhizophila CBS 207.26]